ncbi:hypothetical protein J4458_01665 [Candidatus Woesearchaeota archaeon]|nr:hypothetical protein [Candidatus Woesearchaeota archaeon]
MRGVLGELELQIRRCNVVRGDVLEITGGNGSKTYMAFSKITARKPFSSEPVFGDTEQIYLFFELVRGGTLNPNPIPVDSTQEIFWRWVKPFDASSLEKLGEAEKNYEEQSYFWS